MAWDDIVGGIRKSRNNPDIGSGGVGFGINGLYMDNKAQPSADGLADNDWLKWADTFRKNYLNFFPYKNANNENANNENTDDYWLKWADTFRKNHLNFFS